MYRSCENSPSNSVPLSVRMTLGMPNLLSISTSSHSAKSSGVLCGSFLTSTHFEKQSTATAKTEFPSESVGRDGIRSMAQI